MKRKKDSHMYKREIKTQNRANRDQSMKKKIEMDIDKETQ